MKAAPEDRLNTESGSGGFPVKRVLLIVVIIAVLLLFWTSPVEEPVVEPAPEPAPAAAVVLPPAPDIPVRPEPEPEPEPEPVAEVVEPVEPALPPLAESDPLVREQMAAVGLPSELNSQPGGDNLAPTQAALIDGFSRGLVLHKILPVNPPKEIFSVQQREEQLYMNPAGFQRYDDYARAIASVDAAALVSSFHLLRPLYEQAYGQLGLPPEEFDNAVIRMLDRVLATPEIDGPIALERKSVMYLYADPALEALSPMQKQLLRMGPDNLRLIKEQARVIRAGLLAQD
jgi:Protein of unknown function (DUF3014)